MADDDFEDEPELEDDDLEEDVLDDDFDDDDDEDDEDSDLLEDDDVLVDEVPVAVVATDDETEVAEPVAAETEDDDVVDLDEELHPDDVEEALDVVLRERTAAAGLDDDEDEDEPEPGEGGTKIVPRRENEFLCKSCFLVLPRHQLADEKRMICRDCA
jgi:hypothetical protein